MTREQARASIPTRGFKSTFNFFDTYVYKTTQTPPRSPDQKIECTRTEYISIPPTQ